jgi:hypothetical protein
MNRLRHALFVAIGCAVGCGSKTPPPPVARTIAKRPDQTRPDVERFCGNCHQTPQPESFPRDQWPHEVERGYEFYLLSGRTDLQIPPRADVIAYYRHFAPEKLVVEFPRGEVLSSSRFQKQEWAWPKLSNGPAAIANMHVAQISSRSDAAELILCNMKGGAVSWVTMIGNQFQIVREVKLANPDHVCPTDLDADGRPDFLISDLGSFLPEDHDRGRVVWLRPKGVEPTAEFEQIVLLEDVGRVADAQPADFDGDGDLDIVVAVFGWHSTGGIVLLRQTGRLDGRLQFSRETLDRRNGTIHVPVADLNGDSQPDFVALISQEHESVEAFLSRADGKFDAQVLYRAPDPSYGSSGIELVDLDRDGDLDVLYTNGDTFDSYYVKPYHGIRWIENQGSTGWKDHLLAQLPGAQRALAADLDGDGDLDVAACAFVSEKSRERQPEIKRLSSLVWLEQRAGSFHMHEIESEATAHACLALGDVNGDDMLDIVAGNFEGPDSKVASPVSIWLNQGHAE